MKFTFLLPLTILFVCSSCTVTSLNLTITNLCNQTIYLLDGCDFEGSYLITPSATITNENTDYFELQSNGIRELEGTCTYYIGSKTSDYTLYINFVLPDVGSNSYEVVATPGSGYEAAFLGGDGYHASLKVMLEQVDAK